MKWEQLINDKRLGLENIPAPGKGGQRTDFRRDYDRLVFSSPFRRLQNKTQVFPLPGGVFVHNRLTHSLEVSCVGKSLTDYIATELRNKKYANEPWVNLLYHLGDIVAAACLAHDLGNPPFGHSGEKTISSFFSEGEGLSLRPLLTHRQWSDFTNFEGNANALRALTHRFNGRRPGGFSMTYSTLASIIKYPYSSDLAGEKGKFGFFHSETDTFLKIANELGLKRLDAPEGSIRFARHPLVYIVEAADDICYKVMDLEDAAKLKVLTARKVIAHLMAFFDEEQQQHIQETLDRVDDPHEKISYLRSCVIGTLVDSCAKVFIENEQAILDGEFTGCLLDHVPEKERQACDKLTALAREKIYCARDVVDIELAGHRIITFLLSKLIHAVVHPDLNYSRLLLSQIPPQYDVHAPELYDRVQAVLDHISAMTDMYALDLYRRLNGMSLPVV